MNPQHIILEKSLINSHCEGMDSLVIKDGPGMVRMFIARPEHELWRNSCHTPIYNSLSIALHAHHCAITIMPILGEVWNVVPATLQAAIDPANVCTRMLRSYQYKSPILSPDGEGHFEVVDNREMPVSVGQYRLKTPTYMAAHKMHSVFVPKGQTAAWFIWEGAENAHHNNICYSDHFLQDFDFSRLDRPMTADRLRYDLEIIGVRS